MTPGGRNAHLFKIGRSMAHKGSSPEAVRAALDAENAARCEPPLSAERVAYVSKRSFEAKHAKDWEDAERDTGKGEPGAQPNARPLVAVGGMFAMADAMPDLTYVREPLFIQGQLVTLTAHPGHGKSTFAMREAFDLLDSPHGARLFRFCRGHGGHEAARLRRGDPPRVFCGR